MTDSIEQASGSAQGSAPDSWGSPCAVISPSSSCGRVNIFQSTSRPPEVCLILNELYQTQIKELLDKFQLALDNNIEAQIQVKEELERMKKFPVFAKNSRLGGRPIMLFANPYFRDVRGCVAPENDDAKIKRQNGEVDAYVLPPRPWVPAELTNLSNAVVRCALETATDAIIRERKFVKEKLNTFEFDDKNVEEELLKRIEYTDNKLARLKNLTRDEVIKLYGDDIDFMFISATCMRGTRNTEECEFMWKNYLNPSVNKKKFSHSEDEKLYRLARKFNCRNWDKIAKLLNTNRTAIQCLERYQSHLNAGILNKYWTDEEDNYLAEIVEKCKIGDHIPWHQVAYNMSGRSRGQILNRWNRKIAPDIKNIPWTASEDAILSAAVKKFGFKWKKIAKLLPGRCNYSCRERYTNALRPGLKIGSWTKEEDVLLLRMIKRYGEGKWAKIAKHFTRRTDNMCLQRAICLKRKDPVKYKQLLKIIDDNDLVETLMPTNLATTNNCVRSNTYRQKLIDEANKKIVSALMEIKGYAESQVGPESVPTMRCLKEMSKHLLSTEEYAKEEAHAKCFEKKVKYSRDMVIKTETIDVKSFKKLYEEQSETESEPVSESESSDFAESNVDSDSSIDEKPAAVGRRKYDEEDAKIDRELSELFSIRASLNRDMMRNFVYIPQQNLAEHQVFKKVMFKNFDVNEVDDTDEDCEIDISKYVDYQDSVPRVLNYFVLPPKLYGHMPVLPPTWTNMKALEICMLIRKSLSDYEDNLSDAQKRNFAAITEMPGYLQICVNCQQERLKLNNTPYGTNGSSFSTALKESDERKEIVNHISNSPNKTALVPVSSGPQQKTPGIITKLLSTLTRKTLTPSSPKCECDQIKKMKARFELLRKRFISTFLWPGLLSLSEIHPARADALCEAGKDFRSTPAIKKKSVGRRKVKKKPWVSKGLIEYHKSKNHNIKLKTEPLSDDDHVANGSVENGAEEVEEPQAKRPRRIAFQGLIKQKIKKEKEDKKAAVKCRKSKFSKSSKTRRMALRKQK